MTATSSSGRTRFVVREHDKFEALRRDVQYLLDRAKSWFVLERAMSRTDDNYVIGIAPLGRLRRLVVAPEQ
jgi:hypothetical protein